MFSCPIFTDSAKQTIHMESTGCILDADIRSRTLSTFYVLHPFPQISLETVRVVIPPGVFGPEIAKVVEGAAASEIA